ncbi:MAG TPA: hypothetical protein VGM92_01390, partial [Candidatus Kapabacteria bacterium]
MDRHHFRIAWLALLVFFAAANGARAQWVKVAPNLLPPEAQYTGVIRFHGGVAWAGSTPPSGGTPVLFYSKDTGRTWNPVLSFPTLQYWNRISDIAIFDSLHVLVSLIQTPAIYLTTDGGKTWKNIQPIFGATTQSSYIVQASFNGSADTMHVLEEEPNLSLLTSFDGGATWTQNTPTSTLQSEPLCFAIGTDHSIYVFSFSVPVGSQSGQGWINKSTDMGKTWSANSSNTFSDCNSLAVDSCDVNRLYLVNENIVAPALLNNSDYQSRIEMTTDAGATWQTVSAHPQ